MGCANASGVADRYQEEGAVEKYGLEPGSHDRKEFQKYFILKRILGTGSFAQVHAAVEVTSGREVAVKVLDLQPSSDADGQQPPDRKIRRASKEVMLMMRLTQHPHLVRCYNSFGDDRLMYIVMEYCQSSFLEALRGLPDVTESTYADIFRQLFLALEYMHSKNVVHRDVKPDNLLCCRAKSGLCVKLGDFGLAEVLPSWSSPFPLKGCHGTAPYMSPEMVRYEGYGANTDVWSAGVSAYVLMLGGFPWKPIGPRAEEMKSAIAEAALEPSFKPCPGVDPLGKMRISETGEHFLREVLVRDRSARPTAAKALASKWFQTWAPDGPQPSLRPALHGATRAGAFYLRTRACPQQSGPVGSLRSAAKARTHPSAVVGHLTPSRKQLVYTRKEPQLASSIFIDDPSSRTESAAADLHRPVRWRKGISTDFTSEKTESTAADSPQAHVSSGSASTNSSPTDMLS